MIIELQLALVMVMAFILIFILSLLEVVWLSVYEDDVIVYERRSKPSRATKTVRELLNSRMVVVGFILFAIHLLTYFTPLVLGRLSRGRNGWMNFVLLAYAIILFFAGEVISKNIGYRFAMKCAVYSAILLKIFLKIFFPVTWTLKMTNKLTGGKDLRYQEEDVVAAAQAAEEDGTLSPAEADFIENTLKVGNHVVLDIMVPVEKCAIVSVNALRMELIAAARLRHKILVNDPNDPMTIRGLVRVEEVIDLITTGLPDDRINLSSVMHNLAIISASMEVGEALKFLLLQESAAGIVAYEGRTVGFISLRDIYALIVAKVKSE